MSTPLYDSAIFDTLRFGGEAALFGSEFDGAIFDPAPETPALGLGLTVALWQNATLIASRLITEAELDGGFDDYAFVLTEAERRPITDVSLTPLRMAFRWEPSGTAHRVEVHSVSVSFEAPSTDITLAGAVAVGVTSTAALTVAKPLAGAVSTGLSATGDLASTRPLAGAVAIGVTTIGSLDVPKPLAGSVVASVVT
ncbi:MAG TPA: hypothetical protein VE869_18430, partial [Gemmatimonas sp.]|nr:hypothetical protein [Gemmatimonas sp.]